MVTLFRWADARLRLPVANDPYTGEHNATDFGFACLQPDISPSIPDGLDPQATALLHSSAWEISTASDDCTSLINIYPGTLTNDRSSTGLYINVVKPSNITANTTVPVVVVRRYSLNAFISCRIDVDTSVFV